MFLFLKRDLHVVYVADPTGLESFQESTYSSWWRPGSRDPPGECTEGQDNKNKNRNQSLRNEGAARERRAHEADRKGQLGMKTVVKKGITETT